MQRLIAGNVAVTQDVLGGVTVGRITHGGSATFTIAPTNGITFLNDGAGPLSSTISNTSANANGVLIISNTGTLTLSDSLSIINSGASTNTTGAIQIGAPITGTGNIVINNINNNSFSGQFSAGQIRLTGTTSNFAGTVTLERGAVSYSSAATFGGLASNTITLGSTGGGGATLMATSSIGQIANNLVVAAGAGGTLIFGSNSSGSGGTSGTVLLNGGLTTYAENATTNALTFSNVVSGVGSLTVTGVGNTRLTAANTFTGDTRISQGILQLGAPGVTTQSLALQNSTVDMNAADGGTLAFGIGATTVINSAVLGGLKGSRNIALVNNNTSPASVVLSVGNNNTSNTYSGTLSGGGSFVKVGTGTQTLSGIQTYTGSTTVTAGTLLVTGGLAASSPVIVNGGKFAAGTGVTISNEVTVNSGGRLGGGGTFTDATGITLGSGAILAPGSSPGNTIFGTDLNFSSGAVYEWELGAYGTAAGTDSDLITVTGAGNVVTFDSGSVLTLNFLSPVVTPDSAGTGNFWLSSHQWLIVDADSGGSIVNNGLVIQPPSTFVNGTFTITSSGGDLYLNYAIPEPSTTVLCGLSLAGMLFFRRRRS